MKPTSPPPPPANAARARTLRPEDGAELHDMILERDFLGSCILYPDLISASGVGPSDFASTANRVVFEALQALVAAGETVDTNTVRGALADIGKLGTVGGSEYIDGLTDGMPTRSVPFQRLRKLARRRELQRLLSIASAKTGTDELARLLTAIDSARKELEAIDAPKRVIPTLADAARRLGPVGVRLPTGLPTLDMITRGGIPLGRLVTLLGAPGASKTNFCAYLADGWERFGAAVMFLAADEGAEAVTVRLGQLDGFDREELEADSPTMREEFARRCELTGRRLSVIDPTEERIVLEDAESMLMELAEGRPRVLFVDSIQKVPCAAARLLESRREQVEAVVEVCAQMRRRGTLVVAISEMARAAYRTGKRDVDISALGAGAETRNIEYESHLQLGLRPVGKDAPGLVDFEIAKNRLGPPRPVQEFRGSVDFQTLRWREIEHSIEDEVAREVKRTAAQRERILAAVRKVDCRSIEALHRMASVRKQDCRELVKALEEEGVLTRVGGVYRVQQGEVQS